MAPQNIIRLFCKMGLIILILGCGLGCSRDEQSEPPKKSPKVVHSIVTPTAKKEQAVKENPEPTKPEPAEKKEEKPKTDIDKGESRNMATDKTHSKEAISPRKQEAIPGDKTPANIYSVKPGDNLASIAGRKDVFGDPLKWPILYRLNYLQLKHLSGSNNLPNQKLPQGMKLQIITEKEKNRNLEARKNKFWVINVLSSRQEKEIIQEADKLIQKGYPVYITSLTIKGKKWQRIRIGFFKSKSEADEFGKDLMSKVKLPGFWSVKTGNIEFGNYAGY